MKIFGLFAPSGHGKTSLAHCVAHMYAQYGLKCAVVSITTPIKRDLTNRFGVYPGKPIKPFPLQIGALTATTYREACQFYGDMMREIDPHCFLRELWHTINDTKADVVIVDDLRTLDEVDDLRQNDAEVFLIRRPEKVQSVVPANAHPTERFAMQSVLKPESGLWTVFTNDQPLDLSAQSLYATFRNLSR